MVSGAVGARYLAVEVPASVPVVSGAASARSVEVPTSVTMVSGAVCARSLAVEVPASVPVGGGAASARSVEVPASVPMGGCAISARSLAVEVPASVPVGGGAACAINATPNSRRVRQGAATNAGTTSLLSARLRTEETASALDAKYC
jgi:hypothetical protein